MSEKEIVDFLRANPSATTRDLGNAFPRESPYAVSQALRLAIRSGVVTKSRAQDENGYAINRYSARPA